MTEGEARRQAFWAQLGELRAAWMVFWGLVTEPIEWLLRRLSL